MGKKKHENFVISNDLFPENEENHENFVILTNSFSKRRFFYFYDFFLRKWKKMIILWVLGILFSENENNTTILWIFWISFQKMKNNTKKLRVLGTFFAIFWNNNN